MPDSPERAATRMLEVLRSVLERAAEPKVLLKTLLSEAVRATSAERGVFVEVERDGRLAFRVLYRFETDRLRGRDGDFSRHVLARALRERKPILISDAQNSPDLRSKQSVIDLQIVSVLCVPIEIGGRVAALIHLESDSAGHFSDAHRRLVEGLAASAAPALAALDATEGVRRERDELRDELHASREMMADDWSFGRFVGRAPVVRELERQVRKASNTDFPVLLEAETGTGKSILARVLHSAGARATKAFVTVFCPSLDPNLVESELFGHVRGAFTGADVEREGKVQAAAGGTLFLDEIGELPRPMQPKLLRLLQERTFERVGEAVEHTADVRVIAATNRDLAREVAEGRFRDDLYNRLNFLPIRIPPLRERTDDIPLLLRHCLDRHDAGRWVRLTDEATRMLVELDFAWPGNVRHLEQLAARLATEQPEEPVGPPQALALLGVATGGPAAHGEARATDADLERGLPELLKREEAKWLRAAIERYPDHTRAQLAAVLKIGEATLYKKLAEYGL